MSTCGRRPSCSSTPRVWLKYASVYQPVRIFSTGRSKMEGSSRLRVVATFELQARGEGRLGHLELLGRRFARAEPVLELVARPCERPRERMRRVPRHPAEDLGRRDERAERRGGLRGGPEPARYAVGGEVPGGGREEHRADEVRPTALVLLRARLSVLVRADGDVLGAVVLRELAAASDRRAVASSRAAGRRLVRRRPFRTTALPSIETSTRGRSSGSRASGSA